MERPGRVGVLALQGDFELHLQVLSTLGVGGQKIRRPEELEVCPGLILPGGESTTLYKMLHRSGLWSEVRRFARDRPIFGTCAGCILMAQELEDAGGVEPLGLMDLKVRRNAYGRQVDSFERRLDLRADAEGLDSTQDDAWGTFIRAPAIEYVGDSVEVLATADARPVAVRSGLHVALTFHPEVRSDHRWHRLWLAGLAQLG
jgi:5'-phosphate synthase pdxT subunit